jgi:hypothetical protein
MGATRPLHEAYLDITRREALTFFERWRFTACAACAMPSLVIHRVRAHSANEPGGIADSLNTRQRATHNWHTPLEVFARALASSHKPSTSVH